MKTLAMVSIAFLSSALCAVDYSEIMHVVVASDPACTAARASVDIARMRDVIYRDKWLPAFKLAPLAKVERGGFFGDREELSFVLGCLHEFLPGTQYTISIYQGLGRGVSEGVPSFEYSTAVDVGFSLPLLIISKGITQDWVAVEKTSRDAGYQLAVLRSRWLEREAERNAVRVLGSYLLAERALANEERLIELLEERATADEALMNKGLLEPSAQRIHERERLEAVGSLDTSYREYATWGTFLKRTTWFAVARGARLDDFISFIDNLVEQSDYDVPLAYFMNMINKNINWKSSCIDDMESLPSLDVTLSWKPIPSSGGSGANPWAAANSAWAGEIISSWDFSAGIAFLFPPSGSPYSIGKIHGLKRKAHLRDLEDAGNQYGFEEAERFVRLARLKGSVAAAEALVKYSERFMEESRALHHAGRLDSIETALREVSLEKDRIALFRARIDYLVERIAPW